MKKLFKTFLLAILGIFTSTCLVVAQNITTTIGQVSAGVGDTVTVPVQVTMGAGTSVSAVSLAIGYDSTKLQCLGAVHNLNTALNSGIVSNCVSAPGSRQVRMVWSDLNPVSINGLFFNLKFRVLASGVHVLNWDLSVPGNCEYASQTAAIIQNAIWNNGQVNADLPINVTLGNLNLCTGDTARIPVSILNAYNLSAISLAINYNPVNSQFLGIRDLHPSLASLIASTNSFGNLPQIRASWAEVTPVNINGVAFVVELVGTGNDNLQFDLVNTGNGE